MRILQIRFKNLNSLVGEWEIDFTHPSFVSDGIFAITGPTGAGKTTILDAICLALYGRTPRLNKITKSGNEIMSRQTGDCFAEVTFETKAGRFRCHWSQHRSRKKPDGELQSPKHEITNADSGQIFDTKLRGVADQIEMATGMDFDRFTRSMLLAQGGFAAFLQATPDERSPILEQITGTEIYSQISIRVHERRSTELNKLAILEAEIAGIQLLSKEDELRLKASLDQEVLEEEDLNRLITQKNQGIGWLDGITHLEKELCLIENLKRDWLIRQEAFQPEQQKLQWANQALELAGEHAGLILLRGEQETDRQNHLSCLLELPKREAELANAVEIWEKADGNLKKWKAEEKNSQGILRKVRELDVKLGERATPLNTLCNAIADLETKINKCRSIYIDDCKALSSKEVSLQEVSVSLEKTEADERLVEHLAGIKGQFDTLWGLNDRYRNLLENLKSAEILKTETTQILIERDKILKSRKNDLILAKGAHTQKLTELKEILRDKEIADWRNIHLSLNKRKSLLEKVSELVHSSVGLKNSLEKFNTRTIELAAEKPSIEQQHLAQTESLDLLEEEITQLETQLSHLNEIKDFEQVRHSLQDDEPCPLCGAKEHPFAVGNIPAPDETMASLKQVRINQKKISCTVTELKVQLAKVNKELEQIATRKKEVIEEIANLESKINLGLAALSIKTSIQELQNLLPLLQEENEENLRKISRIVQAYEAIEKETVSLHKSFDKLNDDVFQCERAAQDAANKMESASQAVERINKDSDDLDKQIQNLKTDLLKMIAPYGIESLSSETSDKIQLDNLTSRRNLWIERKTKRADLDKTILSMKQQTGYQIEQISKLDIELKNQRYLLGNLQSEWTELTQERSKLFGDKNPDQEESLISTGIEAAEKEMEGARQSFNEKTQKVSNLKTRLEALKKSIDSRLSRLDSCEELFLVRLQISNFANEASYLAAVLPEDKRKKLMQQSQDLMNEQTGLETKAQEKTTLLNAERQKQITNQSRDQIVAELEGLKNRLKEIQQEMGAFRQRLNENENLKAKQQDRISVLDAQKREYSRWAMLYEFIGSADGKKYRNFAQGLTFETVVKHANRQLQKMTDRYLLITDTIQPMQLNVIDNYQAGEIRTTKNLSGGESFIVSLSLALGLSHMTSKKVRVDSLFLDEGFGTLDEETLETALETLSGLQKDGKLIGVISHVAALKERISTKIHVEPQTAGRSSIIGPGCCRRNQTV